MEIQLLEKGEELLTVRRFDHLDGQTHDGTKKRLSRPNSCVSLLLIMSRLARPKSLATIHSSSIVKTSNVSIYLIYCVLFRVLVECTAQWSFGAFTGEVRTQSLVGLHIFVCIILSLWKFLTMRRMML